MSKKTVNKLNEVLEGITNGVLCTKDVENVLLVSVFELEELDKALERTNSRCNATRQDLEELKNSYANLFTDKKAMEKALERSNAEAKKREAEYAELATQYLRNLEELGKYKANVTRLEKETKELKSYKKLSGRYPWSQDEPTIAVSEKLYKDALAKIKEYERVDKNLRQKICDMGELMESDRKEYRGEMLKLTTRCIDYKAQIQELEDRCAIKDIIIMQNKTLEKSCIKINSITSLERFDLEEWSRIRRNGGMIK